MSRARDTADQINRVNSSAADATALTVDSSERVLIGKTSAGYNVDGFEAHPNGETYVSRSGTPMAINRNSSDGTLLNFYKDGTGVGSIGSVSGVDLFVAGSRGAGQRYLLNNILPCNASGDVVDNTIDFGQSNYRYKDAYLSGGVYLGGTGSANKLEDYEVGTFTPVLEFGGGNTNITYSTRSGFYTKIGNVVYFYAECQLSSRGTSTGNLAIRDLPFSPQRTATSVSVLTGSLSSVNDIQIFLSTNGKINFENRNTGTQSSLTHNNVNSNSTFFVSGTYQTSG